MAGVKLSPRLQLLVGVALWGCAGDAVDVITPAGVRVSPDSVSIVQGDTVQFTAIVVDAAGVAFSGPTVLWSSGDPAVAIVTETGEVFGGSPGVTVVTATAAGFQGQAAVVVLASPVVALGVPSLSFSANAGGADPPEQSVPITNAGGGQLDDVTIGAITYGAGQPTGWLTAAIVRSPLSLVVRVSVAGLAAGSYTASVPLGIGGGVPGATLTVTLVVS